MDDLAERNKVMTMTMTVKKSASCILPSENLEKEKLIYIIYILYIIYIKNYFLTFLNRKSSSFAFDLLFGQNGKSNLRKIALSSSSSSLY